jgi:hypothetical protein
MADVQIEASLSADLAVFLSEYQAAHGLPSLSAALAAAVKALREQPLLVAYRELGEAQRAGLATYPPDLMDGLDLDAQRS